MQDILKLIPLRRTEWGLMGAIVVVVLAVVVLDSHHSYYYMPNASTINIARQASLLGIFALGAAVVIISGGIDLSSGSMVAFSGSICASVFMLLVPDDFMEAEGKLQYGVPLIVTAITITLIIGLLVGTLHAWLISSVGLPPFIATLATLVGLRSVARALVEFVTKAETGMASTQIQIFGDDFRAMTNNVTVRVIVFLVLAAMIWFLLSKTVIGRHIYALGGNEQAARLSGIRTENVKWLAYCIGTVTSSIAGIFYIGDQSVADPQTLGRGYELNAIAAAVVGGCSLQGGVGSVPGTVLGTIFLRTVIDGVSKIIHTGADVFEGLIVGIVVVLAVAFSQLRQSHGNRQFFAGTQGMVSVATLGIAAGLVTTLLSGSTQVGVVAGLIATLFLGIVAALERLRQKRSNSSAASD